jgi:2-polyprenyl-3-methyl-5-hydroxy-6-metoxy-1,4-benzoquinol methylase
VKVGATPEGIFERIGLSLELGPVALADTHVTMIAARTIMAGASLGIYDAIDAGARTAEDVARTCKTDLRATRTLLEALAGLEYVIEKRGKYTNSKRVERWMLARSPRSVKDKLVFQQIEWNMLGRLEEYVRTGAPIDMHATFDASTYGVYQAGMRSVAAALAPIFARHVPVPRGAKRLLDVGGSHGLYSVALCRRHPALTAEILELPSAIEHAAPLLALENMGARVRHVVGDAREELGDREYDVVLLANLVHHFSDAENAALARRAHRALVPGGTFVVLDIERSRGGVLGTMMDLYFALTSASGTWTADEIAGWQRAAGFRPLKPVRPRMAPGWVLQSARR